MLLLTSVVLLIGFLALSSMVLRVAQLPGETAQESRHPIDLEADGVADGAHEALQRVAQRVPPQASAGAPEAFRDAMQGTLDSITELERGRGFRFTVLDDSVTGVGLNCELVVEDAPPSGAGEVRVWFTFVLQDLDTRIQVTVEETLGEAGVDNHACW